MGFRVLGLAILLVVMACSPGSPGSGPVHVVWVVLDAAAARQFRLWGAAEDSAPEFDRLAAESVRFERAIAQWPSTLSSTSSFLTGRYPNPLLPPERLSEPGIATILRRAGWSTMAFSENPHISAAHGFAREFGQLEAIAPVRPEVGVHDRARRNTPATIGRALEWIDTNASAGFFVYLHLLPPHAPYNPPAPFRGRFRDPDYRGRFDGRMAPVVEVMLGRSSASVDDLRQLRLTYLENLAYADAQLGHLLRGLRSRELLEDTLLIVSSDHGEAFGEHGKVFHASNLYDEQLHVPLLIRFPARSAVVAERVRATVELADLVPTILDVTGQAPLDAGGQSLLRVARREEAPRNSARSWLTLRSKLSASFTKGRFKLILGSTDGVRELYDLESDPGELRNVIGRYPTVARYYEAALGQPARTLRSEPLELDAELRQQLEAIGYVE